MTTELEQACERLRKLYAGERPYDSLVSPPGDSASICVRVEEDLRTCAVAYLSQRDAGDGEEPATYDYAEQQLANTEACLYSSDGTIYVDLEIYEIEIKSRRQILAIKELLAALGIPLAGGKEG